MIARTAVLIATVLSAIPGARAEAIATARALFADAWKQGECNQMLEQALNNSRYHELGGGYALGMVLCSFIPDWESQVLFLVAPRTSGRPQLLSFRVWRRDSGSFEPTSVLSLPQYHPETKTITSEMRYARRGTCGSIGEWTWTGQEFAMTGYWEKPDCDDSEFDRDERFRIFPPKP
jgi:hypothetical protein